ncbi:MAG: hypothetical protein ACYCRG_05795 [Acidimicrobiales bacterium]
MPYVAESNHRDRRRTIPYLILALMLAGAGGAAWVSTRASAPQSTVGPEGVVVYRVGDVASSSTTAGGRPIDGIACQAQAKEVVTYHIHVHVSVYVRGQLKRLPAGIGITSPPLVERTSLGDLYDVGLYDCLYWLHTHASDGIIHVEAPSHQPFTLGQFFDVWRQPLSATRVGPAKGAVVVFENGKRLTGDPRATPLLAHGDIQIDVGSPVVAFQPFRYRVTGGCGQGTNSCSAPRG